MMSDWLTDGDVPSSTRATSPAAPRAPRGTASGGLVWAVVGLEVLLLIVGLWALVGVPGMRFVGYLACGIALPLVWALLYVNLKRRDLVDDAGTVWLERINRWLLVAGLAVGIWCAILVALEWAK